MTDRHRHVVRPNLWDIREVRLSSKCERLITEMRLHAPHLFEGPDTLRSPDGGPGNIDVRGLVIAAERLLAEPYAADLNGAATSSSAGGANAANPP